MPTMPLGSLSIIKRDAEGGPSAVAVDSDAYRVAFMSPHLPSPSVAARCNEVRSTSLDGTRREGESQPLGIRGTEEGRPHRRCGPTSIGQAASAAR